MALNVRNNKTCGYRKAFAQGYALLVCSLRAAIKERWRFGFCKLFIVFYNYKNLLFWHEETRFWLILEKLSHIGEHLIFIFPFLIADLKTFSASLLCYERREIQVNNLKLPHRRKLYRRTRIQISKR